MSLRDLLDQVGTTIKSSATAEADRRRAIANAYDPIGEPLADTPGKSFDLGATVDDTNLAAAGGYPPDAPTNEMLAAALVIVANAKAPRPARLTSQRFTFAATDSRPIVVTPSGIDSEAIEQVTLIASAANVVRIGRDEANAAGGGFLPANVPIELEPGCAVYASCSTAATTLDVFVIYRDAGA